MGHHCAVVVNDNGCQGVSHIAGVVQHSDVVSGRIESDCSRNIP